MNIFVARLSDEVNEADLRSLFSPFGEIASVKVIYDRETGQSKHFGFVEMISEMAAIQAIERLHNSWLKGSEIVVKPSTPASDPQAIRRPFQRSYSKLTQRDFSPQ